MSSAPPAEVEDEYTVASLPEVFVYRIPPKSSAAGHRAADWKDQIMTARLSVVTRGTAVAIKLANEEGKLFAVAPVRRDGPPALERVSDSSRYFVLRVENAQGSHAFIGIGFNNRSDAFDFNAGLQDAMKDTDTSKGSLLDLGPSEDFSLKAGEKITIKVNVGGAVERKPAATTAPASGTLGKLPAPGAGGLIKLRAPGAGPSPAVAAPAPAAGGASDDILGLGAGVSAMSVAPRAPAPAPAPAAAPAAADWVSF